MSEPESNESRNSETSPEARRASTAGGGGQSRAILLLPLVILLGLGGFGYYNLSKPKAPHYRKIEKPKSHIRPITVTGEVVDAWCYSSQTMGPGRGESHKACALACSYGGITMGIVEDGTGDLYIAAKSKGYKGCNELLIPFVAQKVTVQGYLGDLGGNRVLRIDKVEPVIEIEKKP